MYNMCVSLSPHHLCCHLACRCYPLSSFQYYVCCVKGPQSEKRAPTDTHTDTHTHKKREGTSWVCRLFLITLLLLLLDAVAVRYVLAIILDMLGPNSISINVLKPVPSQPPPSPNKHNAPYVCTLRIFYFVTLHIFGNLLWCPYAHTVTHTPINSIPKKWCCCCCSTYIQTNWKKK